jgi:hypothetical protein
MQVTKQVIVQGWGWDRGDMLVVFGCRAKHCWPTNINVLDDRVWVIGMLQKQAQ